LGFFRRERPLHEQLAEEAGMLLPDDPDTLSRELRDPPPEQPTRSISAADLIMGPRLSADLLAVHGIPRAREWDAVATALAPGLPGDQLEFVALEDGTLVVDDELPGDALTPLADVLEGGLPAPYHAFAFRQSEDIWSVAALRVDVVEVPEEVAGDQVDLVVNDGERTVLVDEAESDTEVPSLEQFAAQQFGSFVLHASRLDDLLWEVTVLPL
jgi:hypothetical protein